MSSFNLKAGSGRYSGLPGSPERVRALASPLPAPASPHVVMETVESGDDAAPTGGVSPKTPPAQRPLPQRPPNVRASLTAAQELLGRWDLDGDGVLSPSELLAAARSYHHRERSVRSLRRVAFAASAFAAVALAALFAVVLAGNEVSKDMKPAASGVLLNKHTSEPVATGAVTVTHDVTTLADAPQQTLQELKHLTLATGGRLEHFRVDGWTLQEDASLGNVLTVFTPRGVAVEITRSGVRLLPYDAADAGRQLATAGKATLLATTAGTAGVTATATTAAGSVAWGCAGVNPPGLPPLGNGSLWTAWGGSFAFNAAANSVYVRSGVVTNVWDVTLLRGGVWLYPGFQYTLAFTAAASAAGASLTAKAGWDRAPNTVIAQQAFSLTPQQQRFTLTFTVAAAVAQADSSRNSIAFFFGRAGGAVTLADVCLYAAACQSSASACAAPPPPPPPVAPPTSTRPNPNTFANLRGAAYGPWVNQYGEWPPTGMLVDLNMLRDRGVRAIRTYGADAYNKLELVPEAAFGLGMAVFTGAAVSCPLIPLGGAPARPCSTYAACLPANFDGTCPLGTARSAGCTAAATPCSAGGTACVPRDQGVCPAGSNDQELLQFDNAVLLAKRTSGVVIVGNEVLLGTDPNGLNSTGLLLQLDWMRRKHGQAVLLAYADSWSTIANPDGDADGNPKTLTAAQRQQLAAAVDIVLVHVYPYWDSCYGGWTHFTGDLVQDMAMFANYTQMRLDQARQMYPGRVVLLGETGQPSAGQGHNCANPPVADRYNTAAAQREYVRQLANRPAVRGFLFEAFDEPWKAGPTHVESNWGLFYSNRTPKPAAADSTAYFTT